MKPRKAKVLTFEAAWEYSLRIITYRQRSEKELHQKLYQKGYPEDIINSVLDRLKNNGLINDKVFARNWSTYRLSNHPVGRKRLEEELRKRGISTVLAKETAAEVLTEEKEMAYARVLANKYRNREDETSANYIKRLARFLWQRGFSGEIIRQVIAEREADDNYIDSDILK